MAAGESQNAFATAPDFQKGTAAAARIADLLATQPTIADPPQPVVTGFVSFFFGCSPFSYIRASDEASHEKRVLPRAVLTSGELFSVLVTHISVP